MSILVFVKRLSSGICLILKDKAKSMHEMDKKQLEESKKKAEEQKKELAAQLSRIVEHVELLNTLDTDKVEPTAQMVTQESRAQRADRVAAREGSSEAAKTVGLFRVPRVITER